MTNIIQHHGPILNRKSIKPLYNLKTPSFLVDFVVLITQSTIPLYTRLVLTHILSQQYLYNLQSFKSLF